jgi:transketolase
VFYIFTHDSVGVGEDGPTHQPVETVSALRCIPNLDVLRPGDAEETAAAFAHAVARKDGPVALILSRQNVPSLDAVPVATRRQGVLKGGYVLRKETAPLTHIIIGTGSELSLALAAGEELGASVRVVSMPSMEVFARQPKAYQEEVLPASCTKRVSIDLRPLRPGRRGHEGTRHHEGSRRRRRQGALNGRLVLAPETGAARPPVFLFHGVT